MTLTEIESILMNAATGDAFVTHEMLVKLIDVIRNQHHRITYLEKQVARLLEAVPSAGVKVVAGDPRDDEVLGRDFRG